MGTRTVTLTGTVRDKAGHATTTTTTLTVNTPTTFRLGMTAPPGTAAGQWQDVLTTFPNIRVTRDFGKDNIYQLNGAYDADTRTEWSKYGTGKWVGSPTYMMIHLSVKDDVTEFLDQWFASFPATLPADFPGVYLSPWHEPEDDVRAGTITWAWFRQQGTALANYVASHPRGAQIVKGNGPILTRWDLIDLNNDPTNAGYTGMTHFFFDTYQSNTSQSTYDSPALMIDNPANKILAKYPGIKLGIPEWGFAKITSDTTGTARAAAIEAFVNRCKQRGDIEYAAYFNDTGSIPGVPFTPDSPEGIKYKALLAAQ